jgi:hypothetical protein
MCKLWISLCPTGNTYFFLGKYKYIHWKHCSFRCACRKQLQNKGSEKGKRGRRLCFVMYFHYFLPSILKHWVCYQVIRREVPIPAPRQKKGQSSTGISHLVSSKIPDNIVTGKYMINIKDLKWKQICIFWCSFTFCLVQSLTWASLQILVSVSLHRST